MSSYARERDRRRIRLSIGQREAGTAYLFILPWIIGFIIFTIGPMVASLYFSFTNYNIVDPPQWVGLRNFIKLFHDELFAQCIKVTLKYAVMALPLNLVVGFFLAVLLNQKVAAVNVWRTLYFLPSVIAGVAVALVWQRIFNPRIGIMNPFLRNIGIQNPPGWLRDARWAVPSLVIMSLWAVGGGMIMYLAGLQGISSDLYDSAKVDGANALQRFWHVTIPMMTPIIFYNLIMGLISTFQYFTQVYVITSGEGGPAWSTLFYNLYLYKNAFRYHNMGYASAMAWILFLFVMGLTLLIFRSSEYWVFYEGELKGRA